VKFLQILFLNPLWGGVSIKGKNVGIKRRSRTDIAEDILRVAMNGAKKTHIVYEVNLNFNIAQKYLEILNEKELIRHEKGIFITTDKGKVFQEMAKEIKLLNCFPFIFFKYFIGFSFFLAYWL